MKNKQKGFIVPLLLAIIAVLVIGGGAYIYEIKKAQPVSEHEASPTPTLENTGPKQVVVPGMKKYVDTTFGFSFWYPTDWNVYESGYGDAQTLEGTPVKNIELRSRAYPDQGVAIQEYTSFGTSITDNANCGPADGCPSSVQFYFDIGSHTWMKKAFFDYGSAYQAPTIVSVADTSQNSMGGLHVFQGNARFGDDVIVPLSAQHFLKVYSLSAGTYHVRFLANTIVASDPSVATPVSISEQIKVVQSEAKEYGVPISNKWQTYTNANYGFSLDYPSDWKAGISSMFPNVVQFCPPALWAEADPGLICLTKGMAMHADTAAPIVFSLVQKKLQIADTSLAYVSIFNQMKASVKFTTYP